LEQLQSQLEGIEKDEKQKAAISEAENKIAADLSVDLKQWLVGNGVDSTTKEAYEAKAKEIEEKVAPFLSKALAASSGGMPGMGGMPGGMQMPPGMEGMDFASMAAAMGGGGGGMPNFAGMGGAGAAPAPKSSGPQIDELD